MEIFGKKRADWAVDNPTEKNRIIGGIEFSFNPLTAFNNAAGVKFVGKFNT